MEKIITPEMINSLKENEVFVFGSNEGGKHLGGAAKAAWKLFGAEFGNPIGMQGQSYAIPTLDINFKKLPLSKIEFYVKHFIEFAKANDNLLFYVTPIGCGIAGFTEDEIAPMFADAMEVENIALPQCFIDVLDIVRD